MSKTTLNLLLTGLLMTSTGAVFACEYKAGESKFVDYANCRYGEESIVVVDLPEDSSWEQCVYYVEAFRPEKLLAITKDNNGVEELSVNDRGQIGNPCYLTKKRCDGALAAFKKGTH